MGYKMKTIYEIVKEYNELNEANTTPLHGFKVGDKVKYAPHAIKLFNTEKHGEIIKVDGSLLTIGIGFYRSYDLETIQEFYIMPNN